MLDVCGLIYFSFVCDNIRVTVHRLRNQAMKRWNLLTVPEWNPHWWAALVCTAVVDNCRLVLCFFTAVFSSALSLPSVDNVRAMIVVWRTNGRLSELFHDVFYTTIIIIIIIIIFVYLWRDRTHAITWTGIKIGSRAQHIMNDFTFWISPSLRPSLSPKYGLRPKISEKWNKFFSVWTQRSLSPKLIWTNRTQSYWIYMQEIA